MIHTFGHQIVFKTVQNGPKMSQKLNQILLEVMGGGQQLLWAVSYFMSSTLNKIITPTKVVWVIENGFLPERFDAFLVPKQAILRSLDL